MRGAAVALLFATGPARAWDREVHAAIIDAAMRLSPAFAARIPDGYLSSLQKGASEAEPYDLVCATHRGKGGEREAWRRAVKMLAELQTPRAGRTPQNQALLIGQFLHYVADCELPRVGMGERASNLLLGAYDIVVFREARRVEPSLEEYLKTRAAEALWADPVFEAASMGFRDAVNATVDAGLLLPPQTPEGASAPDKGPTLFSLVNAIPPETRLLNSGDPVHEHWAEELTALTSQGRPEYAKLAARGVHVVEWVPHTGPDGRKARVLLFNNQGACARDVRIFADDFRVLLSATVPAFSLKVVEIQAPRISPDDVRAAGLPGACPTDTGPVSFSAAWSIAWITGKARPRNDTIDRSWLPTFLEGREIHIPPSTDNRRSFDVSYDLDRTAQTLQGFWITSFIARDAKTSWEFEIEALVDRHLGFQNRPLRLNVEVSDKRGGKSVKELRFQPDGATRTPLARVSIPETTSRFRAPSFRLVSASLE